MSLQLNRFQCAFYVAQPQVPDEALPLVNDDDRHSFLLLLNWRLEMTKGTFLAKQYRYGFRSNGQPFERHELADFYRRSSASRQKTPFARAPRPTLSSDTAELPLHEAYHTHK